MKKVLLASTAVVMTSGMASAQSIEVTGSAVIGFVFGEFVNVNVNGTGTTATTTTTTEDVQLHYELDFGVTAMTETDGGLGFKATLDMDLDDSMQANMINDPEITISYDIFSVTFGPVGSATDAQVPGMPDGGFDGIGLDNDTEIHFDIGTYNVLATLNLGMVAVSASADIDDSGPMATDDVSIAASFDLAGVKVGVGFEDAAGHEVISVGASGDAGIFSYNLLFTQDNISDDVTFGAAATVPIDDYTSVSLIAGMNEDVSTDNDFGVEIRRKLGGGVNFAAAVGSVNGTTTADAGFTIDF